MSQQTYDTCMGVLVIVWASLGAIILAAGAVAAWKWVLS